MSGETQRDESGWTVDTLKEHVNQRFNDSDKAIQAALVSQEKAVAAALAATKEAVNKAEIATEKRFESVNEFRAQLSDQTRTFMPRAEAEQSLQSVRNEANQSITAISERLADITDRINRSEGSDKGSQLTTGKLVTGLGVALTILTIVVLVANNIFK